MKTPLEIIKTWFETGDSPTEQQFNDAFDSFHHKDNGEVIVSKSINESGDVSFTFSDGEVLTIEKFDLDAIKDLLSLDFDNERVGIGTTNPLSKFHIHDGVFRITGTNGTFFIHQDKLNSYPSNNFLLQTNGGKPIVFNAAGTSSNSFLSFQTDSIARMLIDDNGNVGVGTTDPVEKLDVLGNIRANGDIKIGRNTTNQAESGSIFFLEDVDQDFNVNGYGFELKLNGDSNDFALNSTNGGILNNIFSVNRDTGDFNFFRGLNITGSITASNGLILNGSVTADDVTVNGDLRLSSDSNLNAEADVNIGGDLTIGRTGSNQASSGSINFLEDRAGVFGVDGYGFQFNLNGNTNTLELKSGNASVVNDLFSVGRDTGNFDFKRGLNVNGGSVVTLSGNGPTREVFEITGASGATFDNALLEVNQINAAGNTYIIKATSGGVKRFSVDSDGDIEAGRSMSAGTFSITGDVNDAALNSNANNGFLFKTYSTVPDRGSSRFGFGAEEQKNLTQNNRNWNEVLIRRDIDCQNTTNEDGYLLLLERNVENATSENGGFFKVSDDTLGDLIVVEKDGVLDLKKPLKNATYTFATLPIGTIGMTAVITDASNLSWRGIASGGGSETALVLFDGTNWIYH